MHLCADVHEAFAGDRAVANASCGRRGGAGRGCSPSVKRRWRERSQLQRTLGPLTRAACMSCVAEWDERHGAQFEFSELDFDELL